MKKKCQLPIIAHRQYISFSWGIRGLNILKKAAIKNGFVPITVFDEKEIDHLRGVRHVFVMGVDKSWLKSVLGLLAQKGMTGIIICSDVEDTLSHPFIIHAKQASVIKQSIEHLLQNNKSKLALFGIHKSDVSDMSKADTFCKVVRNMGLSDGDEDVYTYDDDVSKCFHMFCCNVSRYDAVICSNDIVGAYFLKKCKLIGIKVPKDLFVIGNGNAWIGNHICPSLTTFDGGIEENNVCSELFIRQYKILCAYPQIETMQVCLASEIIKRESTGFVNKSVPVENTEPLYGRQEIYLDYIKDPIIRQLSMVDSVLSACNNISLQIIKLQCENQSYIRTAEELFISVDTVKYRLKKIYKSLGVRSRYELAFLLDKYGVVLE